MMSDPYKILGVNPSASNEEVKAAYRELAKKYHPDNYLDNPLSELANEKMKQINEAYDTIQKQRASGTSSAGSSSGPSGSDSYTSSFTDFLRVRQLIIGGRYSEAEIMLDSTRSSERGAEWHFLKGVIFAKRGWHQDAARYFTQAAQMDPGNAEYAAAINSQRENINTFRQRSGGYTTSNAGGCSSCDICSGLICADCCCESMGGDLISCC